MSQICMFKQEFKLYHEAHQSHLKYLVNIPEGIEQLNVHFSYDPLLETKESAIRRSLDKEGLFEENLSGIQGFRNLLTISISDPYQFRGAHHYFNPQQEINISIAEASFGFLKGAIEPGNWEITISNHGIFSDSVVGQLEICGEFNHGVNLKRPEPLSMTNLTRRTPKLRTRNYNQPLVDYSIELHAHTQHSDADQSTQELMEHAEDFGLDWLAITDHNTIAAIIEAQENNNYNRKLQILPGMEFTSFYGHFLIYNSLDKLYKNWTEVNLSNIEAYFGKLKEEGALITIAHPYEDGNPYCTGCRFDFPITCYDFIDTIEVWNEPDPLTKEKNIHAYDLWKQILAGGIEMNASYGRDWHRSTNAQSLPMTHILTCATPSQKDILESLSLGRTYVSCRPRLSWKVNDIYQIGDRVKSEEQRWQHQISLTQVEKGDQLLIWDDQKLLITLPIEDGNSHFNIEFPMNQSKLMRLEVINQNDEIILFTNPIYK